MSSRLDKKKYLYLMLWDKLGAEIKKVLLFALLFTIIVQSIIVFDVDLLPQNTTIELEGKTVIESYHYESSGIIKISVENKNDMMLLKIFVNGEQRESTKNDSIELNVRNNDIIEIDGIDSEKYINVIIKETSENLVFPKKGTKYRIGDNIVALGRVKLK